MGTVFLPSAGSLFSALFSENRNVKDKSGSIEENPIGIREEPPDNVTDTIEELNSPEPIQTRNLSPLQQFRQLSLSLDFQKVQVAAEFSFQKGNVLRTGQLLYERTTLDLRISSRTLEQFAADVKELERIDPELLKDFLALIKLLDGKTPETFDPFFDRLENILRGSPETEVSVPESVQIDLNIPVNGEASTSEQVSDFFFDVEIEVTKLSVNFQRQLKQADPLVLDLDNDGIEVTDASNGKTFDINGDGDLDKTAFVTGGDAFLALDRNGNGKIDDGKELFGDQHGARDGFAELGKFDDNDDLVIDMKDKVFDSLKLYDGNSIRSLSQAGISSLNLQAMMSSRMINGNSVISESSYKSEDGKNGRLSDLVLNYY